MKSIKQQLKQVNKQIQRARSVTLELPNRFSFMDHGIPEYEEYLSFFDWTLINRKVKIDLRTCKHANYQAVSTLVLYGWYLKNNGCTVSYIESDEDYGASAIWRRLGGRGAFPILFSKSQAFIGDHLKPMFAVRNNNDFKKVIEAAERYTEGFDIEYHNTLRYVLGELLYNTLEHGVLFGEECIKKIKIPSIVQFVWYQKYNELHFIIADLGIGIKRHIEQAYPGQESDEAAIKLSLKSQTSGTFGSTDPYVAKNNAGMGLYISSNIIRRLNAEMYILSGDGYVHVSPRDVTGKTFESKWPGTLILVTIKLEDNPSFELHKIMQEFRDAASKEQSKADFIDEISHYYVSIFNYFGVFAEDKEAGIKFRDKRLFEAIEAFPTIIIDFEQVKSSPHSFLSALLASPVKQMGMSAYKRIKIVNATAEIRETIDFIFDENTT